jgi:MFS family permease
MVRTHDADEPTPSLWKNPDFARLWFAQVISTAGTTVTGLALPITAIVILHAGPGQMSLLNIAGFAPNLAFGLFAGVWVDRARRRPILIGADLGRALLLATVPLAAILGVVTFAQLAVVAFAIGTLSACSSLAAVAILPAIVPREQLVAANSRLATTDAALALAAPTVAGGLIQLVGAPRAILADALSYLGSALTLRRLRAVEEPTPVGGRATVWREMGAGLRELVRTPALRALTVAVSVGTFGTAMQGVASGLFLINDLHLTPALLGLLGACGGAGSLLGAAGAERATHRLGVGPTIVLGQLVWAAGALVAPFAQPGPALVPLVGTGVAIAGFGGALWGVSQITLRQALTPQRLFARTTAARRLPMFGMQIAGAALGGILGSAVGLRQTLILGGLGLVTATLLLALSPIRTIRELDAATDTVPHVS